MRKIFVLLLLLGAIGLFAQFGIPAGTKEIGVHGTIGDFLNMDEAEGMALGFMLEGYFGYFFMDNLEGLIGLGFIKPPYDGAETGFEFMGGAYYHYLFSETMGTFGGAWFGYYKWGDFDYMYVPIDAGLEFFISKSIGIRVFNRFSLNLEEEMDNSDHLVISAFGIF